MSKVHTGGVSARVQVERLYNFTGVIDDHCGQDDNEIDRYLVRLDPVRHFLGRNETCSIAGRVSHSESNW